jgi:hypothetical protein
VTFWLAGPDIIRKAAALQCHGWASHRAMRAQIGVAML